MIAPMKAQPEWSHPFNVENLGNKIIEVTIRANAEERARLVKRLDLTALDKLEAVFTLGRQAEEVIQVSGKISAGIKQICVVTLEEFPAQLEENFSARFAPAGSEIVRANHLREEGDGTHEDDIEPYEFGKIDLGEIATQYLALAIDPYPHKPGIEGGGLVYGAAEDKKNPFAGLAGLYPKKN